MGIEWLFGRRKTMAEQLEEQRDALQDVQRLFERSQRRATERAVKADRAARNNAQLGNTSAAQQYARDREQARRHAAVYQKQAADIHEILVTVTLQEGTMNTQVAMARIATVMRRAQILMPGAQFEGIMDKYKKDSSALRLKQELVLDATSQAFEELEGDDDGDLAAAGEDERVEAFIQEIGASEADALLKQAPDITGSVIANKNSKGKEKERR